MVKMLIRAYCCLLIFLKVFVSATFNRAIVVLFHPQREGSISCVSASDPNYLKTWQWAQSNALGHPLHHNTLVHPQHAINTCSSSVCIYVRDLYVCKCVCMITVYTTEPLHCKQSEYNKFVHIICTINLENLYDLRLWLNMLIDLLPWKPQKLTIKVNRHKYYPKKKQNKKRFM